MDNVIYFRNGDANCVYFTKDGHYEFTISKCGEMMTHKCQDFKEVEKIAKNYNFTDDMVAELKNKVYVWSN